MPWRKRKVVPYSYRARDAATHMRLPQTYVARRPDPGTFVYYEDHPIWDVAPLSSKSRQQLIEIETYCDVWEGRREDEELASVLVLRHLRWPDRLTVRLCDAYLPYPDANVATKSLNIVVLTAYSAAATYGPTEKRGFRIALDAYYAHRNAILQQSNAIFQQSIAPDLDDLDALVPLPPFSYSRG